MLRLFGIPESEIAATLRARRGGARVALDGLEITTCLRRGEIEVVTRYEPGAQADLRRVRRRSSASATPTRCSPTTGRSVDEQVARLLRERGRTIATAESCTGGLLAGRLTERPGSSAYVLGGLVVYSNEAKVALAGVDAGADRAASARSRRRWPRRWPTARASGWAPTSASGSPASPARAAAPRRSPSGIVCFSVAVARRRAPDAHASQLPGARADVRDRSTTVAMHLVRRLLLGERD